MRASQPVESRIVGNYVLGPSIGRGATSEVFAAEHRFLGDPVAVKVMRPQYTDDERMTRAFVAEATQTRTIEHPNVVRVLDAGRHDTGALYLVMERITGESLAMRIARGPLAEPEMHRLFAAIAEGMQAVHDAGIVHRDLKPANVMLSGETPKIVDFGIAKYLGGASAAATARVIGTPGYMAPEQLTGGLIAPFVDIWALGVMMFEAVTGRLPFLGYENGRCPQLFETAPRARALVPISASLDELIARCLDKDPARRPTSMTAVAAVLRGAELDLERVTADLDDVAPPPAVAPPARARGTIVLWGGGAIVAIAIGVAAAHWVSSDDVAPAPAPATALASTTPDREPGHAHETTRPVAAAADPGAATEATGAGEDAATPTAATGPAAPAQPFSVVVRSVPRGATIVVDGRTIGKTPKTLELSQPTALVVRRAGYKPMRTRAERAGTIDVHLVPLQRDRANRAGDARELERRVQQPRETLD